MNNPIIEIMAGNVQDVDNSDSNDPARMRKFHAITLDPSANFNQIKADPEYASNDWTNDTFAKIRPVGATIRCFKTSTSDNESGIMVGQYGPVGLPFDDGHTIESELHRDGENK